VNFFPILNCCGMGPAAAEPPLTQGYGAPQMIAGDGDDEPREIIISWAKS